MKKSAYLGWAKRILTLSLASLLVACAAPARIDQMQVNSSLATRTAAKESSLRDSVSIRDVTGGKDTNPLWISSVSSNDFERALEVSLRDAGLWSPNRQASKYLLVVHLEKLDQPFGGFDMTVTANVRYSLVERASNKAVFERSLSTPYTAKLSDAFLGVERMKLANEGAVRTNIQQLIDQLVALKLTVAELKIQQ
ncbi:hypothetical protein [Roseateles sp.]|jgi:hypothetical protein|uniref:hypothetical protein n=1 Tax=Roseateles sp. TaxID=1971397 RepID=UPI00391A74E3